MSKKRKQLGEVLLEEGLVTYEQLEEALAEQARNGRALGRVLIDLGFIAEQDLVSALAKQIGLPFVDLGDYPVDPAAASLISDALSKRYSALPIGYEDSKLVVAMSDPANVFALDDIRTITGLEIKAVVATRSDIHAAIARFHRLEESVSDIVGAATEEIEELEDLAKGRDLVEDAPIVKLVNMLITQAVSERASDIHIEPHEHDMRIRYRIDGVLHEVMRSPKSLQSGVISRLKIMADINIAERRIPQDGRVGLVVGGKAIDLRVATLPTVYGEKVVIRILDKSSVLLSLQNMGFSEHNFARYESSFRKPYGMILVTGPTGSGKSTTLYATLNMINTPDRNIITVEDPVEYRLAGVNQVQVNVKAGLTFALALRSILRMDPDIVLIGEIRDKETATIAIEAALTGHLVLSSLHTNDAASAVSRLVEMEVETFLVASAIDCVVAQRLFRVLCERCKEAYKPEHAELLAAGYPDWLIPEIETLYRPTGCSACSNTGYRGRAGLYEVMPMSEDIQRLTVDRASADELRKTAIEQGMMTLRDDGLEKARMGRTSIGEIARVVK